jgi:exonuclease SbcC
VERLATLEKVMADFKQNVMERVVPTLSEVSSQLFSDMTDSRYGGIELDEDYEMQVYDGQEKYPLSRFSGGESDLANLSLRLAISRVLADRSGNDINFLILDEIFGSQDQVRKRNIMNTLNRLEGQFHQIILISHIDDTKDLMSNVITIKELEDGTSTIEY